jgi:hypothetical protein
VETRNHKKTGRFRKAIRVGKITRRIGDSSVGKTIGQRTVIKIELPDRNVIELYFTPPSEKELLADRSIYTRRK